MMCELESFICKNILLRFLWEVLQLAGSAELESAPV